MLFLDHNGIKIYHDDCAKCTDIPDGSVDLVVTSPPYNVDIAYNSNDDNMDYQKYLEWSEEWMKRCWDLAKDDGRFCLNVPLDKHKDGHQSEYADLTSVAKKVGWNYQTTIIWNKANISKRTAWGSWLSASAPNIIAPVETVVVFYKKVWKKQTSGKSTITSKEFQDWTNGLWTFNGETRDVKHPVPFPVTLPMRCIRMLTYEGDTVLDPFLGSGTTLMACVDTKRNGIGIELDKTYCEYSKKRIISAGLESISEFYGD